MAVCTTQQQVKIQLPHAAEEGFFKESHRASTTLGRSPLLNLMIISGRVWCSHKQCRDDQTSHNPSLWKAVHQMKPQSVQSSQGSIQKRTAWPSENNFFEVATSQQLPASPSIVNSQTFPTIFLSSRNSLGKDKSVFFSILCRRLLHEHKHSSARDLHPQLQARRNWCCEAALDCLFLHVSNKHLISKLLACVKPC